MNEVIDKKVDRNLARQAGALLTDNLFDFARVVLGYDLIEEAVHYDLCEFMCDRYTDYGEPIKKWKLVLMPRLTFKSTLCLESFAIQQIILNPNIRILITTENFSNSKFYLGKIKKTFESNELLKSLYGDFVNKVGWREDYITVSQRTVNAKEPTIMCGGVDKTITGFHYDLIIADDIVTPNNIGTIDQINKVINYYKDFNNLLDKVNPGRVIVIGCLVGDSKILLADGRYKNIKDMQVGDKVVSFNSEQKVEAVIPQGEADVYELRTKNNMIQATPNHPFLTENGFKRLDELKIGEKIKCFNHKNGASWRHHLRDEDDFWLLGYMLGDGWITENPNSKGSMRYVTCVARCVYEERNLKALEIFNKKCKGNFKLTKGGYYRSENNRVARYLKDLGFEGNAKTKRIPEYIYQLSDILRNAFIDGFVDADGTVSKRNLRCVEICNKELIEDLKHLVSICGYKVSNIYSRERLIKAPHSKAPILAKSHHISFGFKKTRDKFRWTRVKSIKYIGKKEVYDLTVSNTHNFVADGLVVHNTRWNFNDLYQHIIDNEYTNFNIFIRQAHNPDGSLFFPKILPQEELDRLRISLGNYLYSCNYENNPVDKDSAKFKQEWIKYYPRDKECPHLSEMNIYTTVDPAISERVEGDFSGIITTGVDWENNKFVLETKRLKVNPFELINEIFENYKRFKPLATGIEMAVFQKVLKYWMMQEMQKRNLYLPIVELKSEQKSKEYRISGLQPMFEFGSIYISKDMRELEDEILTFPVMRHDDLIDPLAYQVPMWSPPIKHEDRRIKKGTFDWWMKKAIGEKKKKYLIGHDDYKEKLRVHEGL